MRLLGRNVNVSLKVGLDENLRDYEKLSKFNIDNLYTLYVDNVAMHQWILEKENEPETTDISKCTILNVPDQIYTGSEIEPSLTVKYEDTTLVEGTDYIVSYSNNTNVGTATVTITGKGSYTGTTTKTFKIVAKNLSKVTAMVNTSNKTYTGKALTTSVVLKDGDTTLKENTAYTVSYKNNKNLGTATVTITGKGNYTGTITKTYKIVIGQTKDVKTKSQATTSITLQWKKDVAVTGYKVYMATSKNGKYSKIATIKGNGTTSYKKTGLKAGKTYYFKVRAYKDDTHGAYSSILTTTTKTATPKISKVTAGTKKATAKWNKVSGATGYEVYMATSKNGKYSKKTTITKNSTVAYTQKKLTKGKTYYFKIRTYRTVDGKKVYSSYSSVKSVKIKK